MYVQPRAELSSLLMFPKSSHLPESFLLDRSDFGLHATVPVLIVLVMKRFHYNHWGFSIFVPRTLLVILLPPSRVMLDTEEPEHDGGAPPDVVMGERHGDEYY